MVYCWNCGTNATNSNKYCPECGVDLKRSGGFSPVILLILIALAGLSFYLFDSRNTFAKISNEALVDANISLSTALSKSDKYQLERDQCFSVYNQSKQSNLQLYTQYQYCQDQFTAINSSFKNCQTALSDCQGELGKFKTSPEFFFSTKMNYANDAIRAQAAQAKESFRKEAMNGSISGTETASYRDCAFSSSITGMDQYYIMSAMGIYMWVRDNVAYVLGSPSQTTQTDLTTLRLKAGKCDEEALLLISMAKSIGLDGKMVIVKTDMSQAQCDATNCSMYDADHAIAAIYVPGISKCGSKYTSNQLSNETDWVLLDPTCKQCKFWELPPTDIGKAQWFLELI